MTGLNTKNSDIIDLLTTTNNKLDDILTALTTPPAPPTTTLDDIKLILDDIKAAVTPIEPAIVDLKAYLVDTMGERLPESIFTLWNMTREILTAQSFLVTNSDYLPLIKSDLDNIKNIVLNAVTNIGLDPGELSEEYTGYLFDVLDWLGRVSGALGLPIDANNRNVIQLLAKTADRPESQIGSGLAPYDICTGAYISSGMTIVPYNVLAVLQAIVFAVFPDPPPTGISFGDTFGIGVDQTELHISGDDWSGYSIYVASSANNFALNSSDISTTLDRYATNVWVDISFLAANLSVFVNGDDSLRVYLCGGEWGPGGGGGGPWGGGGGGGGTFPPTCYEFTDAQSVLVGTAFGDRYIPTWSIYGVDVVTNETPDNEVFVSGDWSNWTWVSSGPILQIVIDIDGEVTVNTTLTGTCPVHTGDYLVAFVSDTAAFDLTFCPPE